MLNIVAACRVTSASVVCSGLCDSVSVCWIAGNRPPRPTRTQPYIPFPSLSHIMMDRKKRMMMTSKTTHSYDDQRLDTSFGVFSFDEARDTFCFFLPLRRSLPAQFHLQDCKHSHAGVQMCSAADQQFGRPNARTCRMFDQVEKKAQDQSFPFVRRDASCANFEARVWISDLTASREGR